LLPPAVMVPVRGMPPSMTNELIRYSTASGWSGNAEVLKYLLR
jgi:hypothetical protein